VRPDRGADADAAPIASDPSTPDTTVPSTPPSPVSSAASSPATEAPTPPAQDELTYEKDLKDKERAPAAKAEPPAQTSAVDIPTSGRPGTWVLQVSALQNRGAASKIVQRLIASGYPAFLLTPAPGSPQIFRVQIGKYSDRREAEQVARRLEKEEQFRADIKR